MLFRAGKPNDAEGIRLIELYVYCRHLWLTDDRVCRETGMPPVFGKKSRLYFEDDCIIEFKVGFLGKSAFVFIM